MIIFWKEYYQGVEDAKSNIPYRVEISESYEQYESYLLGRDSIEKPTKIKTNNMVYITDIGRPKSQ